MHKADWAVARHALRDALPPALIGLVACAMMVSGALKSRVGIEVPAHSTWPLLPLVVVAAWAGIGVLGELRGTMAHTLARPLHRARLLGIRAFVNAVTLGGAVAVIRWMSWSDGAAEAGPPFAFMVGLIIVAFGIGTVAGACAATETGAVGGTVVGLALIAAPVVTLLDLFGVSWPRVSSALGPWMWPAALFGGASLVWPVWHVVRQLPLRQPRSAVTAVATIAALHLLALAVIWQPAASRATRSVHGERMAIDGVVGGPRVVFTGTDGKIDGVYVDRGGRRMPIYGEGARRSQILGAKVSPDGGAIALLVRPFEAEGRRIVLVDLHSGHRMETEIEKGLSLGAWGPNSNEMAFIVRGEHARLGVVNLADARIRELPWASAQRYSHGRVLGWRQSNVIVRNSFGVFELVSTTGEDSMKSFDLSSPARPVIAATGIAWVRQVWRRDVNSSDARRTLMIQAWDVGVDPVVVELEGWLSTDVTALGFLDDEHVYVELAERRRTLGRGGPKRPKRLYIVHRSGEVRSVVEGREGYRLHSLTGPPEGPWLATDIYGRVGRLHPDGQVLSDAHGRNWGSRSERWIPMRHIPSGVAFVHDGRLTSVTLTDLEGPR